MWMNACVCACVYLFVCVYAPVCSGMLGQALHYGAHDFFPEKHVSPFLKSASSSDRQLAVSPAVCMSVHVCIRDLCRSVCACMCVCTDIPKVTPTCSRPCFPYPHFPHPHSSTLPGSRNTRADSKGSGGGERHVPIRCGAARLRARRPKVRVLNPNPE